MKPETTETFDEAEIVAALRAGSAEALAQIMTLYRPRLHALAFRYTRNHHEAEDIVQEAFVRAYRAAPRFRGDSSLATWLHIITLNLARNRYGFWQRRRRHEAVSLDQPLHPEADRTVLEALAGGASPGAAESDHDDLAEQIAKGIERLSEQDRRILTMRTVQHAAYTEISRVLGIALGTVKSRLARARGRLRALIEAEVGGELSALGKLA
jgi:RNA polymerase sigma-70 factor (ECF subfamily)